MRLVAEGMAEGMPPEVTPGCVVDVVVSHDQAFDNYPWLWPHYGKLLWVDFREPAGRGPWRTYDRYWWTRHSIVSHNPDTLYDDHVRMFVDPRTRRIDLLFWFELPDGTLYSRPPDEHFYQLEADYFQRFGLCGGEAVRRHPPHRRSDPQGPEPLYCMDH